jgi:hypothetical protein
MEFGAINNAAHRDILYVFVEFGNSSVITRGSFDPVGLPLSN